MAGRGGKLSRGDTRRPHGAGLVLLGLSVGVWAGCSAGAGGALAQPADTTVEAFYAGRTLDLVVGFPPGGSNDVYARHVARHLSKHVPGTPRIISRNMPGAGGLAAANWLYNQAPKDGTVIGLAAPALPLDEKLGTPNIRFETAKFQWIGRVSTSVNQLFVWQTSKAMSVRDAYEREITLGATGAGSTVSVYPNVLNKLLGTRFKIIMGYKSSTEAMLALERGETEGHSTSWEALKSLHADWIREGKVRILLQFAAKRHAEMPDVPTAFELAKSDEQRAILKAVLNAVEIGKSFKLPPEVPAARVNALRRAFDATMKDPEFLAEFKPMGLPVEPMTGEDLQALVADVAAIPPELAAKVKAVYGD